MNVGPTADGRIVPLFEERLRQMGMSLVDVYTNTQCMSIWHTNFMTLWITITIYSGVSLKQISRDCQVLLFLTGVCINQINDVIIMSCVQEL